MLLAEMLESSVKKYPEKFALISQNQTLTYEELYNNVKKTAAILHKLGIRKGDKVGILLANNFQFVTSYYAVAYLGAVIVPMNIMFKPAEIKYIMGNSEAKMIITSEAFAPNAKKAQEELPLLKNIIVKGENAEEFGLDWDKLQAEDIASVEMADISDEEVVVCLYTSGTTGRPKGAMLTHSNLTTNALAFYERVQLVPEDTGICVLPLFHTFAATCSLNGPIRCGCTIILMENFIPHTLLRNIDKYKATVLTAVPSMFTVLTNTNVEDIDISTLRLCVSGGASLPVEVLQQTEEKLGAIVMEGYGLSETSPVVTFNEVDLRKPGAIGSAINGVEVKIFDENDNECPMGEVGEIVVRGDNVMKGYLGMPEETVKALKGGWLHTGDLGRMDEDKFVFLVDRKKDLIISAGLNVYPREIEEVIYTHPSVMEVAVIGVPDKLRGEACMAVIVPKEGAELKDKTIIKFCREQLAAYKVPRKVAIVDKLPKNATGKIMKRELREQYK